MSEMLLSFAKAELSAMLFLQYVTAKLRTALVLPQLLVAVTCTRPGVDVPAAGPLQVIAVVPCPEVIVQLDIDNVQVYV